MVGMATTAAGTMTMAGAMAAMAIGLVAPRELRVAEETEMAGAMIVMGASNTEPRTPGATIGAHRRAVANRRLHHMGRMYNNKLGRFKQQTGRHWGNGSFGRLE